MRKPPKIASWALKITNRKKNRDVVLGDFEEFFNEIYEESGAFNAYAWYCKQSLKSIPRFILTTIYWRITMFKNYLKIALRNIVKHKVFSLINITGFAISLSLCLLVVQTIFSLYSSDGFHENKDRIFRIITSVADKDRVSNLATAPLPIAEELKVFPEIETVLRIKKNFGGYAVYQEKKFPVQGYYTDKEFFKVFSFELESGDPGSALSSPYSVVLTKDLALKFFGSRNPLGKNLSFKDLGDFKITGVMKDASHLKSHLRFECLASASTLISLEKQKKLYASLGNWKNINDNYVYFLLRDNASAARIEKSLSGIVKKHYPDKERTYAFRVQALTGISPGLNLGNFLSPAVPVEVPYIFSCIAFVILLIACFNYTNLSLAKALSRAKEVGVRKVIGANRPKIFAQFIGEAVVIAFIALVFAILFLEFLEPFFYSLNYDFRLVFGMETRGIGLILVFLLFTVFSGVLAGFLPAISLSKFPALVLKDNTKIKLFSRLTLRKVLVVFQFFISFIFIITTIVLYSQLRFESNLPPGFNPGNILNVELQEVDYDKFRQEVSDYHNISAVSASSFVPGSGTRWITTAKIPNVSEKIKIDYLSVDEYFIENLQLEMTAGRNFPPDKRPGNEKFVVLNEKAVEYFGFGTPVQAIGKYITFEKDNNLEVIGVVKNFIADRASTPIRPLALRVQPQDFQFANLKFNQSDIAGTIQFLKEKWKELEPIRAFKYQFYEDQLKENVSIPKALLKGIGFITFLTILVAFFGLLGMVIYDTEARVKEIGIRKIMGGSLFDITLVISKGFIYLLVVAAILAVPVAWLINNMFLQSISQRISLGFGIFAMGISIMCAIGFIVIFSQTIRAAKRNPVEMLRYE
jgi:putative ABC transport system permease protein